MHIILSVVLLMGRLFLLPTITVSTQERDQQRTFQQPEKVFIAVKSNHKVQVKEAIMIYLEEAMNDTEGDLLVEARTECYTSYPNWIRGGIEYPPSGKKWYFVASWKLSTKGGGFLFLKRAQRVVGGCSLD